MKALKLFRSQVLTSLFKLKPSPRCLSLWLSILSTSSVFANTEPIPGPSELNLNWSSTRKTELSIIERNWISSIEKRLPSQEPAARHQELFDEAKALFLSHEHPKALQKLKVLELELAKLGPSASNRRALGELEALRANLAAAQSDSALVEQSTQRVLSLSTEHTDLLELLPSGAQSSQTSTRLSTAPRWQTFFSKGPKRSMAWRDASSSNDKAPVLAWNPLEQKSEGEVFQILYASRPAELQHQTIKIQISANQSVSIPAIPGLQQKSPELAQGDSVKTEKSFWKSPWVYVIAAVLAGGAAYGVYEATRTRETE